MKQIQQKMIKKNLHKNAKFFDNNKYIIRY